MSTGAQRDGRTTMAPVQAAIAYAARDRAAWPYAALLVDGSTARFRPVALSNWAEHDSCLEPPCRCAAQLTPKFGGNHRGEPFQSLSVNRSHPTLLLRSCTGNVHCRRSMPISRLHVPLSLVVAPEPNKVSDGDLARALIAGEPWAQAETWNRFAPLVFGMAARTLGSESEAEDVAQEVFYRLFVKANSLRTPESLRAFVISFAIRILKWELRRKRMRSWLSFQRSATLADVACDALDFESRDVLRRFYAFLSRQAPRERLVLSLRYLESMTVEEISKAMEISESTVKRSLDSGKRKLLQWVETDLGSSEILDGRSQSNET